MPIKRSSNKAAIKQWVDDRVDMQFQHIIQAFHRVGLEAVTIARDKNEHTWETQTGNLQSSFGYVIVVDGQIYDQNFEQKPGKTGDGSTGYAEAQSYAKEIASQYSKGIQLIVVAGMPYAQYVEARGYNVLDKSEVYATKELAKKIKDVMDLWK